MKSAFSPLASALAGVLLLAALAVPAAAHAYLIDSFPAAKQRLNMPISAVKLRFAGTADANYSTISLEQANGAVLATGTQSTPKRELDLPAPALPPGRYYIRYRVLSTDGDIVEGKVDFVID